MTMAAGIAALKAYDAAAVARVNALGDRLREGLNGIFRSLGMRGQATGLGSLLGIQWREGAIRNARDAAFGVRAAGELPRLVHLELMNRGLFLSPGLKMCTSTPMTEHEVDRALEAFKAALQMLVPYIAEYLPHLQRKTPS